MGKIVEMDKYRAAKSEFINEDVYRDLVLEALGALDSKKLDEAEDALRRLLETIDRVSVGGGI